MMTIPLWQGATNARHIPTKTRDEEEIEAALGTEMKGAWQ